MLSPHNDDDPVQCLGMTFPNDHARCTHFTEKLRGRLKDPAFRNVEGFPLGDDEDILAMSDPPYYTACPNPFTEDFIRTFAKPFNPHEPYERKPLGATVSQDTHDHLHRTNRYWDKISPRDIVPYLLHYTEPGDLVLDGFCGSGMTGVAAHLCEHPPQELKKHIEDNWTQRKKPLPTWGNRPCILGDISPIATFIAHNCNMPVDLPCFHQQASATLTAIDEELSPLYQTNIGNGEPCPINFTVWSEVFLCRFCLGDIVSVTAASDHPGRELVPCPHCGATSYRRHLETKTQQLTDPYTITTHARTQRVPVLINYSEGRFRHEKTPDNDDLVHIGRINDTPIEDFFPTFELPFGHLTHTRGRLPKHGVHCYHHLFLPRQLRSLAAMWRIASSHADQRTRHLLLFLIGQCVWGASIQNRYRPHHWSSNNCIYSTYFIPTQTAEVPPSHFLHGKFKDLLRSLGDWSPTSRSTLVTTTPCSHSQLPDASVDYVFTNPPFGENTYYSDLNLMTEAWHRVRTNSTCEGIIDRAKEKSLVQYRKILRESFQEYFRVLKPGRWMTVVLHFSDNSIWTAIQKEITAVGFVVAGNIHTLGSFEPPIWKPNALPAERQRLVLSAYRPR